MQKLSERMTEETIQLCEDISLVLFKHDNYVYQIEVHSRLDDTRITLWEEEIPLLVKELQSILRTNPDKP